jgi:hypothetical protein
MRFPIVRGRARYAVVACAGAALVVVSAGLLGGSASAGPPATAHCPKHYLCVWADPVYQGQEVKLRKRGVSNKIFRKMNDQASSAKNHRSHVSFLYSDIDGSGGESYCFEPNQKVPDLGAFSDVASSSRLTGEDNCPV